MTKLQFWRTLKSLAGNWRIDGRRLISKGHECPVCAVANHVLGRRYYGCNYAAAATYLDLDMQYAHLIAAAADLLPCISDDTRRRILEVRNLLLRTVGTQ